MSHCVKKEVETSDNSPSTCKETSSTTTTVRVVNHGNSLVKALPMFKEMDKEGTDRSLYTDFVLNSMDEKCFAVHAIVIMAGSESLKKDLMHRSQHTNTSELTLTDVRGEELEWMLKYIYRGEVELESEQDVIRMSELIDKFGLIRSVEAPVNDVMESTKETKAMAFYEELRKGGVMREGQRGGKCVQCGKSFTHFSDAKRHYKIKHEKPEDPSKLVCPICGKQHSNRVYLDRHLNKVHKIRKRDIMGKTKAA